MAVTRQIMRGGVSPFIITAAAVGLGVFFQATSLADAGIVAKPGISAADAGHTDAASTQVFEKKKKKKKTLRGTQTRGSFTDG